MLEALILCDRPPRVAETVHQHIDALLAIPGLRVRELLCFGETAGLVDFDRFDVIVIHYSLVLALDQYVARPLKERLRTSHALKAIFIQDEYRHIDATIAALRYIGIDVIFTCMPEESIEAVYPVAQLPGVRKENVLTGYVPANLLAKTGKPLARRRIDVGYRARKVPAWLGDLGQEKWNIGMRFAEDAQRLGLKCDISYREEDRLYGSDWIDFVLSCKAMLGVESGSSVFDFTGEIQSAVDRDSAANPQLNYLDLKARHFANLDEMIDQRQISPRCFEAAALKTLMILYEGHYSGLLVPWRHYVPLKKDHSNLDEVMAVLRHVDRAQQIVDYAYLEVACNPQNQFNSHASRVAHVLHEEHKRRAKRSAIGYTDLEFAAAAVPEPAARRKRVARTLATYGHYILLHWIVGALPGSQRDKVAAWLKAKLRPAVAVFRSILGSSSPS